MKTIVALSTANASSAIAMLRLSGDNAVELASTVFVPFSGKKLTQLAGYTAAYGHFSAEGETIDDGVVIVYKAPRSYTGENMAELCCHGNRIIADKIMAALINNGAVPAAAGEFTKRAFFNGKMDLSQAEAVAELISADGEAACRGALMRREGKLGQSVDAICDKLLIILSDMGVWADYPEETDTPFVTYEGLTEDLTLILREIEKLCDGYKTGRLIERGIKVAVVGAPNVGKSTLSNVLWERERSIVTSIAGTTRDVIEGDITIKGIKITLLDTAGIRETPDEIEKIGVNRSCSALKNADLVLLITDATRGITAEDESLLALAENLPHIVVFNKSDIANSEKNLKTKDSIMISALNGEGVEELKLKILEKLEINLSQDTCLIASARQYDCLLRSRKAVEEALLAVKSGITFDAVGILIDEAASPLLELVGKSVSSAVTDKIFERFCVGK